ncbi:tetratricopeptide repeat protein [Kamptonema animale CS-326]|jgi:tetratricopeptide (TPR) repeat protein|uniref:tetratricopeptide repeat protein n=1 Tax=Kamptonema animale TaxID=92934 RepID=UPI00232EB81A|nr:tetratricopeptide repeat protein [Kamptonema animale]MDB9513034.1 tetratricopeptide repeat protein [Kamptonema animale CS-326]
MVQPSPSPNLDDQQLPQEIGVCQELSTGSSNEGTIQGASAGRDSNQIHGDNNTIIQNVFTLNEELKKPWGVFKKSNPVSVESTKEKVSGIWQYPKVMTSLGFIFLLGTTTFFVPQIRDSIEQSICFNLARKEGKLAIAVAKFHNSEGNSTISSRIEDKIIEHLKKETIPHAVICRVSESVPRLQEADRLGEKLGAALIIWGRQGGATLEVSVTAVNQNSRTFTKLELSAANSFDFDIHTKNWPSLVFLMTACNLSKIYNKEGRFQEAPEIIEQALEVESMKLELDKNKRTTEVVSGAYVLLGNLYSPYTDWQCSNRENCEKALGAYRAAFDWNNTFYEALRKQALLYYRMGNLTEAQNVYTKVIESAPQSESKFKPSDRVNRATVYLEQGNATEAVKDLDLVCQQVQCDLETLKTLGLAQLQAKHIEAAIKTYRDIMRHLSANKTAKDELIDELHSLAKNKPDLLPDINETIANIK